MSDASGAASGVDRLSTRGEASVTISVGRALSILDAFMGEQSHLPLSELARRVDLPKTTAFRLVTQLTESGYLVKLGRHYRLSSHVFELGNSASASPEGLLREVSAPHMAALFQHIGFGVHLAALDGTEVVYLDRIRGPRSPSGLARVGARMPALTTGLGKAMVAFDSREAIVTSLNAGWPRWTPYTVMRPDLIARQLGKTRESGVAYDREETQLGLTCVAAPILSPQGQVMGAISASGPASRFKPESAADLTRRAARLIASDLLRASATTG